LRFAMDRRVAYPLHDVLGQVVTMRGDRDDG
jgi:hypothetical protein